MAIIVTAISGSTSTSVNIQPAQGTIYSFKRGAISVTNVNNAVLTITTSGRAYSIGRQYATTGLDGQFASFFWSEGGVTANNTFGNLGHASPFTAISNVHYPTITCTDASAVLRYTMIGVSIT